MKNLWAPWRIDYILAPKPEGCFLCDVGDPARDRERYLLQRGRHNTVVLNRYPYMGGHLMVSPYRHVDALGALSPEETLEMMELARRSMAILDRVMKPHGYNVGLNLGAAAGAGVRDHLHLHVVPRWNGDTNFMPVLGGVNVLPQALDDLYLRLQPLFAAAD